MNEEEQAKETVAGWLGHRPQREVLVAIIASPFIVRFNDSTTMSNRAARDSTIESVKHAIWWADEIIRLCKEIPPP